MQVSLEADGNTRENGNNAPGVTIAGELWIETSPAGEVATRFKIEPTKEPKQIDRVMGFGRQSLTLPGIYRLEDDTLTISMPVPLSGKLSQKRPSTFATKPGDPFGVFVYKRIGAAEELQPLAWQTDWKTAFASARGQNRLVFVDYFATWCKPCHDMEDMVFVLPSVRERLADFVLLRIDVDKNNIARAQHVDAFPTFIVYDAGERERFRILGERAPLIFRKAMDDIRSVASKFVNASDLFDQKKDLEAEFLVGNTYSHLGMGDQAREAYARAHKLSEARGEKGSAQLADALSAFTFAREGNPGRAIKLLQKLAAAPADRDTEALIWLTMGNVQRLANDPKAALEAYQRAQSLAKPESTAYKEAAAAMASLQ